MVDQCGINLLLQVNAVQVINDFVAFCNGLHGLRHGGLDHLLSLGHGVEFFGGIGHNRDSALGIQNDHTGGQLIGRRLDHRSQWSDRCALSGGRVFKNRAQQIGVCQVNSTCRALNFLHKTADHGSRKIFCTTVRTLNEAGAHIHQVRDHDVDSLQFECDVGSVQITPINGVFNRLNGVEVEQIHIGVKTKCSP